MIRVCEILVLMSETGESLAALLRESGRKATPGRLLLLGVLANANHPLSTHEITTQLKERLNQATVYRALLSLTGVGIVKRVNMQHLHAHYELISKETHHHHIICKHCGLVEDVERCDTTHLEKLLLKKSKKFTTIHDHSLEFFGFCKKCATLTKK